MIFFDFEVFKYDWLVVLIDTDSQSIDTIINDSDKLKNYYESHKDDIWSGYNAKGYDQYILKAILSDTTPQEVNNHIINGGFGWEVIKSYKQLYIFDVMTTTNSLKELEGFMGHDIRECNVSFDLDRPLTDSELEEVQKYCQHDVEQTIEVFLQRKEEFDSQISLLKDFNLPLKHISKTKAQLSAIILNAKKQERSDEFDITIPWTLLLKNKTYQDIYWWYMDKTNRDYEKSLRVDVSGVPHIFAWGGLHGAINNYIEEGLFLSIDVASYYPALMIEYNFLSRNVADKELYRKIRDERLKLKAEKNPMQQPYKIVLNSTYGAMKGSFNDLYDPLQANNVCVGGQLLLLDLIEKLEGYLGWKLIQSNTDGVIGKIEGVSDIEAIKNICSEWEKRTHMSLEFEEFTKVIQKDVNNYIIVKSDGGYKSKGAYVKKLGSLDNDLPIVNKAIVNYFIKKIPIEKTILECSDLGMFQRVVKVSHKYKYALYGDQKLKERCLRVFASKDPNDCGIYKFKNSPEKISYVPERCFIDNRAVLGRRCPRKLDKDWYVRLAKDRITDYTEEEVLPY